ncbi:MAG: hypothetical protein QXY90_04765 [Candidatus Anstonellales archaeon]
MRRPRKGCGSTGGIGISDDLFEGYLVDSRNNVIGEAREYDPYSCFGYIMLYEIDSFGFVPGYVSNGIRLMSEDDLKSDEGLRRSLEAAKYETWKRHNIVDLIAEYDRMFKNGEFFETFCKRIYRDVLEKEKKKL